MIKLQQLASDLQEKLNGKDNENIDAFGLNGFFKNTKFSFFVSFDEGVYRDADTDGNTVTYYINAIMRCLSSDSEGTTDEAYNASMNIAVEFLIPFSQKTVNENGVKVKFADAVRNLIDTVLQSSAADYMTDEAGIVYYVGAQYRIAGTGTIDIRAKVGESITLSVYADYFFVASGIGSGGVILKVGGETVLYTQFGALRRSTQDGNVLSDEPDPTARVRTASTALTINFAMPARLNAFSEAMTAYLLSGEVRSYPVEITVPVGMNADGSVKTITKEYEMEFSESSLNAELSLCASTTVTMVEVMNLTEDSTGGSTDA